MNAIERLSRMRRRILWIVLAGTGAALALLVSPIVWPVLRTRWLDLDRSPDAIIYGAFIIWALTLVVFAGSFALYKRKLRKDPGSKAAIDDERIRTAWLRAYRTAFFVIVALSAFLKLFDMVYALRLVKVFLLPDRTWLVLAGAVLSLVGSFLYFSRESADE
jgi:MFS family permease